MTGIVRRMVRADLLSAGLLKGNLKPISPES